MIWLSWRQHRLELFLTLALTLLLAGAMTVVTYQIPAGQAAVNQICARVAINKTTTAPSASSAAGDLCLAAALDFDQRFSGLDTYFELALFALPGLAGVFIGAPLLAREFEQGTVRLVWTQGITRLRWLGIKLGLILTGALVVSAVLALAGARLVWSQEGIFSSRWYTSDIQGPAFVGHVIFALALGTAAGALIRRTVPAMGATLVAFVAIQLAVFIWVRPVLQVYQPESRFWLFQGIEASLFVVLAAALVGVAIWSVRRAQPLA